MKLAGLVLAVFMSLSAFGQLPDAPQPQTPVPPLVTRKVDLKALTWHQTLHSKTFWVFHGAMLASTIYDVEITHEGLAHHKCVENSFENQYPSRGDLYKTNLPFIAGFTVADLLLRKVGVPFGYYVAPAVGSFKHLRGGTKWLTNCW